MPTHHGAGTAVTVVLSRFIPVGGLSCPLSSASALNVTF